MGYRISIVNGKPLVEADSADEAHAFVKKMSAITQPALPRQYKSTKKTTHRTIAKTNKPWTKDEVYTVMNHLHEHTKIIARYVPTHTPGAVGAFVYTIRNGAKPGKAAQGFINEWNQEHSAR